MITEMNKNERGVLEDLVDAGKKLGELAGRLGRRLAGLPETHPVLVPVPVKAPGAQQQNPPERFENFSFSFGPR